MKKAMLLAAMFGFSLTSSLSANEGNKPAAQMNQAAPAEVTVEGVVSKVGDNWVITVNSDSQCCSKGDKLTIKGAAKEGDTKVTGYVDHAKKEITVKKVESAVKKG